MPTRLNIAQPNEVLDAAVIPPEFLAIHASPATVAFAEHTHQIFLDTIGARLESTLGVVTRTAFVRTRQSSLSQGVSEAEPGVYNVLLSLAPLAGFAVLRFSPRLLFKALDILLVSPFDADETRGETVTDIELHILRGFFQLFSEALADTWRSVPKVALTLAPERCDEILETHGESHMLTIESTLEIGGVSGTFDAIIPAFLVRLAASFSGLHQSAENPGDPGRTPTRITQVLGAARVEIDAVLSNLTIRFGDLAELETGQLLLADKAADSTFECLVNKRSQFRGELVSARDRYGFQLTSEAGLEMEAESPLDR